MNDEQVTMTREAWRRLERREECARDRHHPCHHFATLADQIGFYRCECGDVKWTPSRKEAP